MAKKLLIAQFNYEMSEAELDQNVDEFVEVMLGIPGLEWKIWIRDSQERITGGVYLFDSEEAAEAYAQGPIPDRLRQIAAFSNLRIHLFDIVEGASKTTRAPI